MTRDELIEYLKAEIEWLKEQWYTVSKRDNGIDPDILLGSILSSQTDLNRLMKEVVTS